MNAIFLVQKYDYADPRRGLSFEYVNFLPALKELGYHVTEFDYPTLVRELGRSAANRQLSEIVSRDQPELLFGVVRHDYISRRVIRRISEHTATTTVNWFCDDHWQFDHNTRRWAPCFNAVATTSLTALERYRQHQITNVIKSQWGASPHAYPRLDRAMRHDVSFIGQPYGIRKQAIDALRKANINVQAFGHGWPNGKLNHAQMIELFASSRINLNFADASQSTPSRLTNLANSCRIEALKDKPLLWRGWQAAQYAARWQRARSSTPGQGPHPKQIKGRVFEVPCCGGFLLTQPAENLGDYLRFGKECGVFDDIDDLINRVRYYLKESEERDAIAQAGHQRVMAEHRWDQRLRAVFSAAGAAIPTRSSTEFAPAPQRETSPVGNLISGKEAA